MNPQLQLKKVGNLFHVAGTNTLDQYVDRYFTCEEVKINIEFFPQMLYSSTSLFIIFILGQKFSLKSFEQLTINGIIITDRAMMEAQLAKIYPAKQ